ncbi:hypothetical protein Vretifemale_11968 [Volvox reticuliferus]|nr:hypothetical protein Vretifemale_11968 [Volvox reticuliferus]
MGELLQTNAGRPLRLPPQPPPSRGGGSGGGSGGGGGASGGGRRPTPPRPQPSFRDSGASGSSSSSSSSSNARGSSSSSAPSTSSSQAGSSSSRSSSNNKGGYNSFSGGVLGNTNSSSSSRGGGSGGGNYSGRGSGPVVASSLALSWSDDAPGWQDMPLPPLSPSPKSAARVVPSTSASSSSSSISATRPAAATSPSSRLPQPQQVAVATSTTSVVPLSAPPGEDPDILSPAPLSYRAAGIASTSGRPPPDAAGRLLVLPTMASLSYLDGTLPGDFGFDPLGLFDPSNGSAGFMSQRWLHTAELIHARWAMLGAAGCLAPEYLAHEKVIPKATGLLWFKTGFFPPASAGFDYGVPLGVLFALQMVMMGVAEGLRCAEYMQPGSLRHKKLLGLERLIATTRTGSAAYPGGVMFNPLGLGEKPAAMRELQQSEIRHGRLAMLACLGYAAQALVTGRGPYDNWNRHLEDPETHNVLSLLGNVLAAPTA